MGPVKQYEDPESRELLLFQDDSLLLWHSCKCTTSGDSDPGAGASANPTGGTATATATVRMGIA